MKKVLTSILIILLMFNFICCNVVYADPPAPKKEEIGDTALQGVYMNETDNTLDEQVAASTERRYQ